MRRLSVAFAAYERCFLGAPLAEGETASQRAFRVYFARTAGRSTADADAASTWPKSCALPAQGVEDELQSWSLPPEVFSRLRGPLEWAASDPSAWDAAALEMMDRQWALVPRAELHAEIEVPPGVEAPPPSAPPLDVARIGPGHPPRRGQRDSVVTDPVVDKTLRLLLSDGEPDTLCVVDVALALARCRTLPRPLVESLNPRLASMAEGAPLVVTSEMVGKRRRPGLFVVHETRAELVEPTLFDAPPAFVDVDGELVILRRVSEPVELEEYMVRTGKGGTALLDVRLDLPTSRDREEGETIAVDLVHRDVLWARTRGDQTELSVTSIPKPDPRAIVPASPVGWVPTGGAIIAACQAGETTSLLWSTASRAVVLRKTAGVWTTPVPLAIGAPVSARLTCTDDNAVVTSVVGDGTGRYRIHKSTCDAKCTTATSEPIPLVLDGPQDAVAAPVDDRVALVWRRGKSASRSLDGVAFVRVAPLDALHTAEERPLKTGEGLVTSADGVDLFPTPAGVAITLTTGKGAFGACVPNGGALTPLRLAAAAD